MPFTQEKAWMPQTWHGLGDVEYFWRLNDDYLERYRIRGGIGYVLSKTWRAVTVCCDSPVIGSENHPTPSADLALRPVFSNVSEIQRRAQEWPGYCGSVGQELLPD